MKNVFQDYFAGNTLTRDFFQLVVGEKLGEGIARQTYVFQQNPAHVIKFETGACSFQNILEWNVWEAIRRTQFARWFAPCHSISECGSVLIQSRVDPVYRAKELPTRVPAFFHDLKIGNWGKLNGKPVCCDYGLHGLLENGMTKRMRIVKWHGDPGDRYSG